MGVGEDQLILQRTIPFVAKAPWVTACPHRVHGGTFNRSRSLPSPHLLADTRGVAGKGTGERRVRFQIHSPRLGRMWRSSRLF